MVDRSHRVGLRKSAKHLRALKKRLDARGEQLHFAIPVTLPFLNLADAKGSPHVYAEGVAAVSDDKLHYFRSTWSNAEHLSVPLRAIEHVSEQQISLLGVVATPGHKPIGLVIKPSRGPTSVLVATPAAREFFREQYAARVTQSPTREKAPIRRGVSNETAGCTTTLEHPRRLAVRGVRAFRTPVVVLLDQQRAASGRSFARAGVVRSWDFVSPRAPTTP